MESLRWKTRISVLWIFMSVAVLTLFVLHFAEREFVEKMWNMMSKVQRMMLFKTLIFLVPVTMAVLSLILKDSANRWMNFVLGTLFTIFNIFHLIKHFAQPSLHEILIIASTIVVTALIVWYALKWPKEEK